MANFITEIKNENIFCTIAHPFRFDNTKKHFELLTKISFNGIEILSSNTDCQAHIKAKKLLTVKNLLPAAGSDAHDTDNIGKYYMDFHTKINSITDLVNALNAKNYQISHTEVI